MRAKPEHIRTRFAFLSSLGVTAIIATFWVGSFTSLGTATNNQMANILDNAGTPGQSMIASAGSFFNDIKDMIFGPKKVTFSTVEVSPGKN